jgi:hypothetical protein
MRAVMILAVCAVLLAGCAGTHSYIGESGDVELLGPGTVRWTGPGGGAQNFTWEYETEAWRGERTDVFHRMRTEVRLTYDVATMTLGNVTVTNAGSGHAFRHVCLTPGHDGLLSIRMTTLLTDADQDVTVVKIHSSDPNTHSCEEFSVGPEDGLVEGVDILFKEDGTFTVLPNTGAYLAGTGLAMERRMTLDVDRKEVDTTLLP